MRERSFLEYPSHSRAHFFSSFTSRSNAKTRASEQAIETPATRATLPHPLTIERSVYILLLHLRARKRVERKQLGIRIC